MNLSQLYFFRKLRRATALRRAAKESTSRSLRFPRRPSARSSRSWACHSEDSRQRYQHPPHEVRQRVPRLREQGSSRSTRHRHHEELAGTSDGGRSTSAAIITVQTRLHPQAPQRLQGLHRRRHAFSVREDTLQPLVKDTC